MSAKPKVFKSQDELDGICDFILDNLDMIYKDSPSKKDLEEYIISFKSFILTIKAEYFYKIKTSCRKDITKELYSVRENIQKYNESLPERRKINLRLSVIGNFRVINDLLRKCLIEDPVVSSKIDYYKKDLTTFLDVLIGILKENILIETDRDISNFQTNPQSKKKFRFFLLNTNRYTMSFKEIDNVLSAIHSYEMAMRVMAEELKNPEMKNYIFSMLNIWRSNVNKKKDPYFKKNVDKQLIAYCAMMILKRVLLANLLTLEDQQEMFIKYIDRLNPDLETLDDMIKTALNLKQQKRKYSEMMTRLREKMAQKLKRQEKTFSSSQQHEEPKQQIRQWQQRVAKFLEQLDEENKKQQETLPEKKYQQVSTSQQQQQQQKKRQQTKQQFIFDYVSPGYQHRQDKRISPEQNRLLQQRKLKNIENVQSSIISQSIPTRIMEIAIHGNYSSILLVDVANRKRGFTTQQQMLSNMGVLIPWDVPKNALRKPLYVLVEQAGLDKSALPKATFEEGHSGVLHVKVSCVKQSQDGRKIDCYKKEKQGQFTKNPMDDFVLLTLKYTLRSYYYKYMDYLGLGSNTLKKLENIEQLFTNNPYNTLLEEEDIGDIVRQTYDKIKFDKKVPYTWIVSNDQWKDWKRKR